MLHIYRQENLRGFYRGITPTVIQIAPYMAFTFGSYEAMKRQWNEMEVPGEVVHPISLTSYT